MHTRARTHTPPFFFCKCPPERSPKDEARDLRSKVFSPMDKSDLKEKESPASRSGFFFLDAHPCPHSHFLFLFQTVIPSVSEGSNHKCFTKTSQSHRSHF